MDVFEVLKMLFPGLHTDFRTNGINQMHIPFQCTGCQKLISDMMEHMDAIHSNPICEYCAASTFDYYNDEEAVDRLSHIENNFYSFLFSILENMSPPMSLSIRLSHPKTKRFEKKVNALNNDIETVQDNIQDLNHQCIHLQQSLHQLSEECSSLEYTCQQQNLLINKLQTDQNMTKRKLLETQKEIEDLHYASYDGSLVWRIDHFAEKFEAARSEQQTSIYSPIFYSSSSGYKMLARLNLHGDGHARGTHMSIFLVLLKGDYDPILTWPFTYPVTFCLFDQTGQGYHIVDKFNPDTTSASFQKPSLDMNIASGILKFCPLAAVEQEESRYVRDDRMFIKIMVDFLGVPQAVLPYTLATNPGLPIDEQEAQRRTEVEKHKQIRAKLQDELARNDEEVREHSLLPTGSRVSLNNKQHPSSSTTNLEPIPCQDILNDQ